MENNSENRGKTAMQCKNIKLSLSRVMIVSLLSYRDGMSPFSLKPATVCVYMCVDESGAHISDALLRSSEKKNSPYIFVKSLFDACS